VSGFLPAGAVSVLTTELNRLIIQKPVTLNLTFAFGFIVAVWSASGGVKSLIDGLNIAFETTETRGCFKLTFNALLLTVLVVAMAAGAVYVSVTLQRLIASQNSNVMQRRPSTLWRGLSDSVFVRRSSQLFTAIFPIAFERPGNRLPWGSAFASLFWLLGTWLFALYAPISVASTGLMESLGSSWFPDLGLALYRTFADGGRNCL